VSRRVYDYVLIAGLRVAGLSRAKTAEIARCSVETVSRVKRLGLIPSKPGRRRVWRATPCVGCGARLRVGHGGPRCDRCDRRHCRNGSCACGVPWRAMLRGRVAIAGSYPKQLLPCMNCGAAPTPARHGGAA